MPSLPQGSICLGTVVVLAVVCAAAAAVDGWQFVKGASTYNQPGDVAALVSIGGTHARTYVQWAYVQPELKTLEPDLRVDALRANPALIDAWAATVDWTGMDHNLQLMRSNNITLIVEVGEGTIGCLPKYNGSRADPNIIGRDLYLAYQYRFSRAAVRRYKSVCRLWQTENELNEAWLSSIGNSQRLFHLGGAWKDWGFLTQVPLPVWRVALLLGVGLLGWLIRLSVSAPIDMCIFVCLYVCTCGSC